ncbi:MAG: tRNA (cytidine(34)-2'-O)-methyltransferase [Sphingomonadales bacterium]|nr:MAG: tRNA (cytidine(34)-2'-O)-methyltransferase [Sphingomonadales bacterium]
MRIALFQPEIAGNVGAVLRTAACFGAGVDLIEPMGFPWSDKRRKRSSMDYEDHVEITRHADWDAFAAQVPGRLILFSTKGDNFLHQTALEAEDTLLFGSESAGAPDYVHLCADQVVRIAINPAVRSLNLGVSAGIALAEAIRQTNGWPSTAE